MRDRRPRQIIYVCSAFHNQMLLSHTVEAINDEDAMKKFEEKYGAKAQIINGPFFRKRSFGLPNAQNIKFAGKSVEAIYNEWLVSALLLKEPVNCAYLLFDKRVDNKKLPKPAGTFIVKLDDIRII